MAPEWARSPLPSGSRPCPLPKRPPPPGQARGRDPGGGGRATPAGRPCTDRRGRPQSGVCRWKASSGPPLKPLTLAPPYPAGVPGAIRNHKSRIRGSGTRPAGGRDRPHLLPAAALRRSSREIWATEFVAVPERGGGNRTVRPLEGRGPLSCEGSQAPPFLSSSPQKRRAWLLRLGPSSQATAFPLLPRPLRLISAPCTERAPSLTAVSGPSEASDSAPPPPTTPTTKTTLARRRTRPF